MTLAFFNANALSEEGLHMSGDIADVVWVVLG